MYILTLNFLPPKMTKSVLPLKMAIIPKMAIVKISASFPTTGWTPLQFAPMY